MENIEEILRPVKRRLDRHNPGVDACPEKILVGFYKLMAGLGDIGVPRGMVAVAHESGAGNRMAQNRHHNGGADELFVWARMCKTVPSDSSLSGPDPCIVNRLRVQRSVVLWPHIC